MDAMLISKENRKAIYEYLFKEGVLVAKKDFNLPKHPEIDVPNLEVIKAMQSLNSREYVKTQFSWQYFYYTLTDKGIQYLRDYLHLPAEIVPATFKKSARAPVPSRFAGAERQDRQDRGGEYRRKKESGAPGGFRPEFRGGVGRGARQE